MERGEAARSSREEENWGKDDFEQRCSDIGKFAFQGSALPCSADKEAPEEISGRRKPCSLLTRGVRANCASDLESPEKASRF